VPVKFLSDEWIQQVKERLNASDGFRTGSAGAKATLQQVVSTSEGESRYWIVIDHGTVDMGPGDTPSPDATITQDYETAVALAKSEINPVSAFMSGKLKVGGSMMLLMQLQGAFAELPKVMAEMDVDY
jgi:putative sterol carrier protein